MRTILTGVVLAATAAGAAPQSGPQPAASVPFKVQVVADFESPWAMTFLPDGRMLITEKAGILYLVSADGQQRTRVDGIPAVASGGQGGFMDVVLHPGFAQNRLVYFSYSEAGPGGKGVVLARGALADGAQPALREVRTLFRASPYVEGDGHFSGRIAFSKDGYLFFTNGDRQKFDPAQDPKATLGKVLRLKDDGTPAPGNPLAAKGFDPAIWSYGHRNLLGIAIDASGNLWEQEMGPKGGDEANLILPGRNYGWPIASDGDHYDNPPKNGAPIPDHDTRPEFEKPKVSWNPVISPGGLMVYSGKLWPQWKGDLFIGGLSSQALIRVDVDGTSARKGDQWPMGERIREPEEGPDGAIWLLEDGRREGKGRLLKLTP
jgi:glucose/arabinose dehydrogenase